MAERTLPFVMLSNLLAVATDPAVDILTMQQGADIAPGRIAHDARTTASLVVVPALRKCAPDFLASPNADPLVNNGARMHRMTAQGKSKKEAWAQGIELLTAVDADASKAFEALVYCLTIAIHESKRSDHYRAQWHGRVERTGEEKQLHDALRSFLLDERSGGRRWENVVIALSQGEKDAGFWTSVEHSHVNSADRNSGALGDVTVRAPAGWGRVREAKDCVVSAEMAQVLVDKCLTDPTIANLEIYCPYPPPAGCKTQHGILSVDWCDVDCAITRGLRHRRSFLDHLYALSIPSDQRRLHELLGEASTIVAA